MPKIDFGSMDSEALRDYIVIALEHATVDDLIYVFKRARELNYITDIDLAELAVQFDMLTGDLDDE